MHEKSFVYPCTQVINIIYNTFNQKHNIIHVKEQIFKILRIFSKMKACAEEQREVINTFPFCQKILKSVQIRYNESEFVIRAFYKVSNIQLLTKHFAHIRFNIHILQMLPRMGMIKAESTIKAYSYPYTISNPCHLTNLTFFTRVGIKCLLKQIK